MVEEVEEEPEVGEEEEIVMETEAINEGIMMFSFIGHQKYM